MLYLLGFFEKYLRVGKIRLSFALQAQFGPEFIPHVKKSLIFPMQNSIIVKIKMKRRDSYGTEKEAGNRYERHPAF